MKIITNLEMALKNPSTTKFLKFKIKGEVPKEIAQLYLLEELYLEGEFSEFEIDLSHLDHLRGVIIKSSCLKSFPADLLKTPSLQNLKIISGVFTDLTLPLEIISPLRSLTIKDSNLCLLPLEFGQFEEIVELNLSGNKLTSLPRSLPSLRKLSRLNIDGNHFEKLDAVIKECPSLRHLSCDGNLFSEEEKFRIQREFNITPS